MTKLFPASGTLNGELSSPGREMGAMSDKKPAGGYSGRDFAAADGGLGLTVRLRAIAATLTLAALVLAAPAARAVEAVNVRIEGTAIDLTAATELQKTATDRIQVSTAPGADSIVRRIEVRARDGGTNWAVFALTNNSDEQIDRLIVVPHYRMVGSGLFWPDLGLSRIVTITPSTGDRPVTASQQHRRRFPRHARSRHRHHLRRRIAQRPSCRRSIFGSRTPTRTRSTPSRSITASSSASPACWRCSSPSCSWSRARSCFRPPPRSAGPC